MADCVSLWGRLALGKPATVLWGREGKGKELAEVEKPQAEEMRSQLKASTNHHTCEWMRLWPQSLGCDPRYRRVEINSPSCVLSDQKANCCFTLPSHGGNVLHGYSNWNTEHIIPGRRQRQALHLLFISAGSRRGRGRACAPVVCSAFRTRPPPLLAVKCHAEM